MATWASGGKAGWQQVKINRRRSSSILSSPCSSTSLVVDPSCLASSVSDASNRARRLMPSIALKRPVDTSHARGLAGTPSRDHCSTAIVNASCSASSAASKSPSRRIKVARTWRDSERYTASTNSCTCLVASSLTVDKPSCCYFFDEDFLRGTLAPARRASDNPIAIACLRLFTFLPDRPLLSFPFFRSCIALLTFLDAALPYLAIAVPSPSGSREELPTLRRFSLASDGLVNLCRSCQAAKRRCRDLAGLSLVG